MKTLFFTIVLFITTVTYSQTKAPATLKSILLEQLRTTHNAKDWFVPVNIALEGVTPEQAKWTDGSGNHSIGQLASHLLFWDLQQLAKFKKVTGPVYSGNNDETFNEFTAESWTITVQRLDSVLTEWEKAVEAADENTLQKWYSTIAHIGTHNAYHTGQIIFIRKLQGIWNPENGVK